MVPARDSLHTVFIPEPTDLQVAHALHEVLVANGTRSWLGSTGVFDAPTSVSEHLPLLTLPVQQHLLDFEARREALKVAFEQALNVLSERDSTLLRTYYLDPELTGKPRAFRHEYADLLYERSRSSAKRDLEKAELAVSQALLDPAHAWAAASRLGLPMILPHRRTKVEAEHGLTPTSRTLKVVIGEDPRRLVFERTFELVATRPGVRVFGYRFTFSGTNDSAEEQASRITATSPGHDLLGVRQDRASAHHVAFIDLGEPCMLGEVRTVSLREERYDREGLFGHFIRITPLGPRTSELALTLDTHKIPSLPDNFRVTAREFSSRDIGQAGLVSEAPVEQSADRCFKARWKASDSGITLGNTYELSWTHLY